MIGTAKADFQIGMSPRGRTSVKVTRPGDASATQFEFRSKDEAEAWLSTHQERGTFDRSSDHPLAGPRETD
jgi:hypothetical protein